MEYDNKTSPTSRSELKSYIGNRLINQLHKNLIYRKFRYNNIRKALWPTKQNWNVILFWNKFKDKPQKLLKSLYKTIKYSSRKRSGFWKMKMYYWKFKSIYLKHPYKQFAQRYYPKIWYKVFRRKFPLKRHRKDWAFRINKAKHMKYFKHEKMITMYDSSLVYFKYYSSDVKRKKYKTEKRILNKFSNQKDDELVGILKREINPDFKFRLNQDIKQSNWKVFDPLKNYCIKSKKFGDLSHPSLITRGVGQKSYNDINSANFIFNKNILSKKIRVNVLRKIRLISFFFESISNKIHKDHWSKNSIPFINNKIIETKKNFIQIDNIVNSNKNQYNIFFKNVLYSYKVDRSMLVSNFIKSYYQKTNDISDLFNGESIVSSWSLKYCIKKNKKIDKWLISYIYKTKYRKTSILNVTRFSKIKYYNQIDSLILNNSFLLDNKYVQLKSKFFAQYKDIDYLTNKVKSFQFTNRISNFYKKNLWLLNTININNYKGNWSKITVLDKEVFLR